MTTYYSTFTSGLAEVVKEALAQQLGDVKIDLLLDGLIIYQSDRPLQQVKSLRFFNNTFLLLRLFQGLRGDAIPCMMQAMMKKPEAIHIPRWALKGCRFFRLMASRENQTVTIERELLARMESFFSHKLGLTVQRSKPDVEVWFLERSEGYGIAGIRITRTPAAEKTLQKGELKPELAHLLCLISEPGKADVFLDPFAGSGAIPIQRAKIGRCRGITASDRDKDAVRQLRGKIDRLGLKVAVEEWDALRLEAVADNAIDRIVTDPPWGIYDSQGAAALEKLYAGMLRSFVRVMKENGVVVILMGQKELFAKALRAEKGWTQAGRYDILVSGKKATVYKLRKKAA